MEEAPARFYSGKKKEMDYQEQPSRLQAKSREINVESSKRT